MSRTATRLYTLPLEEVGKTKERVPRELRKGVPDEYTQLFETAKIDSDMKVKAQWKKSAKLYVLKLYNILIDNGYAPKPARVIVTNDCSPLWSYEYVSGLLPEESKDQGRQKGGKASAKARELKRATKKKEDLEKVKPYVPTIEQESKETQDAAIKMVTGMNSPNVTKATKTRVATLGGEAKRDKYGNEVFSDMGNTSAEIRHGTYKVAINREEHKEIAAAFEQSLMAGAGGCYTIYVKEGEYERVEANLNGNAEQSINR